MRVKICGIQSEDDLRIAIKADADAVGFLVGQVHASTDFILPSTACRLCKRLPPYVTPVIVTHLTEPEDIMEIVDKTGITTIQLHGGSSLAQVKKLRDSMPLNSKLLFTAHVVEKQITPELDEIYPYVDAILLDSFNLTTGQVGGTGKTHDWDISAVFATECPLPVVLAGGLNPDNVEQAIKRVGPHAVDANSGLKASGGGRDPELCRQFVRNAKHAMSGACS